MGFGVFSLKRFFAVLLVIGGLFVAGCPANIQTALNKEPAKLQPYTERIGEYVFTIPANFKIDEDASFIYENKGTVRAYLVYVGKASTDKLVRFFDEYMTKNGWEKELFIPGEDTVVAYSRGKQLIVFKIHQAFNGTILKVLLTTK